MSITASEKVIKEIFNGRRCIEVPFFQRSYVWGENQWDRFLEDMEEISANGKNYFMGSIILKQQLTGSDANVGDVRIVIDGQQRLTTLHIFLKVLCLLKNQNHDFDQTFRIQGSESPAMLHNRNDQKLFNKIINLQKLEDIEDSKSHIDEAYNYFKKNIDKDKLDFYKIIDNIQFVGIDLTNEEDEQQIFDTINSLGVKLTPSELLKNYLFGRSEEKYYKEFWEDVFEKDVETKAYWDQEVTAGNLKRSFIDLFFYSMLQILSQNTELGVNQEDRVSFSRLESLFGSYKKIIKDYYDNDKHVITQKIKQYADLFKKNFDYSAIKNDIPSEAGIERVNNVIFGLDNITLLPYALFILDSVNDTDQRNELFDRIESYVFRRIIVRSTNKGYSSLFLRMIRERVLTRAEFDSLVSSLEDTDNRMPTDDDVRDMFHDGRLENKRAARILYYIETKMDHKHDQTNFLHGINAYSLEHLMPKNWQAKWQFDGSQEDREARDNKLRTMGNLSILTMALNSEVRDNTWANKKNGVTDKNGKQRPGLSENAKGLRTLSKYLELDDWNESAIDNRASELCDFVLDMWRQ